VSELCNAFTSREDVRRAIEKELDAAAPEQVRRQSWGRTMSAADLERLKGRRR